MKKPILNKEFRRMQKLAGLLEEENPIADNLNLTQRNFPNEQNEVVKNYLNDLREYENNNTDDLDDLKNLITAVDFFHKELMKKLKT
jgi:hypothetical protein